MLKFKGKLKGVSLTIVMMIVVGQFMNTISNLIKRGLGFGDYLWVWKESVCTFEGMDIIDAIKNHQVVNGIEMPAASATMPYARVLANLIHPGFLDINGAMVYGFLLYLVTFLAMFLIICKKVKNIECKKSESKVYIYMLIALAVLSPWYWTDVFLTWNNGALFAMFLIIAVCIADDHEEIAGVLLAFAMIKPQLAALFYISFFLKKKYKTIMLSVVILCISWGVYLLYVGGDPVSQLLSILGQSEDRGADFIWFGIFDGITRMNISGTVAIACSMIFGIVVVLGTSMCSQKTENNDELFFYSIPAVISTVWCYKSTSDLVIMILPNIMIIVILMKYHTRFYMWCILNGALVIFNIKVFSGILRRLFHYNWLFGVNLDAYARTLLFLLIFLLIMFMDKRKEKTIDNGTDFE